MSINTITSLSIQNEATFNSYIPGSHIDKVKVLSDAIDEANDLTRPLKKQKDGIKSKACFAYGNSLERKRLKEETDYWSHCKDIN